jgi:GPH family glycoside/pentoside/hexuronide:cation symporter
MERRAALFIGIGGLALAQGGPATLRLLGLLPLDGAPLAWLLAGVLAGGGALMSMAAIAFMSMMADAADEHEQLYGTRREGLYFAGWAFAGKAAHGAGTLISGLVLQLIRFPSGTGEVDPAELAPRTVEALGFFYGPAAAALAVLGTLVLRWYRLDRAAHRSVLAELHARRRGATVEQAAAALGQ